MPYDLFISYARHDNTEGRITQFIERIGHDFAAFANALVDVTEHTVVLLLGDQGAHL